MNGKLLAVAMTVATASLFLDSTEAEAGGQRGCNQRHSNYRQTAQHYSYPSSSGSFSNVGYSFQSYAPYTNYSTGYGSVRGYSYPSQNGYSSHYGYQGGNSYRNGYRSYGYPTRSGLSFSIGTGGYRNRGLYGFGF